MKTIRNIIIALVLSTVLLIVGCNWYISSYASSYVYNDIKAIPINSVGLILGTSKKLSDGRKNLYFHNRIQAAVDLYTAKKIAHILVSGDNGSMYYNEPMDMKKALLALGIPDSIIYLDYAGFSTFDSMIRSKKVFGQQNITVISQQFHNERAVFIARERGITAIAYNARDVAAYNGFRTRLRELLARVKVFLDLYILNQQPKYLGPAISIPS